MFILLEKNYKKAFTFRTFGAPRVHRLRLLWRFCEYLWREGSRPESPLFIGLPTLMWRVNPRFLLSHAYAKEINKERKQLYGYALKTYKRIYIYYNRRSQLHKMVSSPISYLGLPMTYRDFPVSHWDISVTYRDMLTIKLRFRPFSPYLNHLRNLSNFYTC